MKQVYLDYNATTPIAPEVLDAMLPFLRDGFGNPSSIHGYGRKAKDALYDSRDGVAHFLGANPKEICFTSGGTEADNLAILGLVASELVEPSGPEPRRHIISSTIEHHAVLKPLENLSKRGFRLSLLSVDDNGCVKPEVLKAKIDDDTLLVSVMLANNETGVVQPVADLAAMAHEAGAFFHTDAVQACGKLPVKVEELGVDLLSLSAHKLYGPKGVGALYVRRTTPFKAVFHGGGQERTRRPGTEDLAGIVGLAAATELAGREGESEAARLSELRDSLENEILGMIPDSFANGGTAPRTPNTVNFRFEGVEGESLAMALDRAGFAVSTGAACSAGAVEPSHVLMAMGLDPKAVQGSIRVSLGKFTTKEDVESFGKALRGAVDAVRSRSDKEALSI